MHKQGNRRDAIAEIDGRRQNDKPQFGLANDAKRHQLLIDSAVLQTIVSLIMASKKEKPGHATIYQPIEADEDRTDVGKEYVLAFI
eukprot:CAMPEP_0202692066 /NCGR_PEP_ID=MMETSP1385-20130828/6551_1 /ASSEMBLY_ACC=CAM_ASM_000861 /TAXON_ID=933848 /ORGANISM="Elphidium margaritaceum" /LENGTH=85 /DNA_ID=CAMNT_0049347539 /DNA_START=879 /DNA_END=1136 /DNA_ORIENTATION=+